MKIASFNINSVRSRLVLLQDWLKTRQPDLLLLQEIKCQDEQFPVFEMSAAGWQSLVCGQKAYNGVAILARQGLAVTRLRDRLPGDDLDETARFLEVEVAGLRVINVYVPNGNPAPGVKYDFKLAWLARLRHYLAGLIAEEVDFIIGGDFNILPDERDVYDPPAWRQDALFRPEIRAIWRGLLNLGLTDALRADHDQPGIYTFWDYQNGRFHNDEGLRIDHFLLSPRIADRLQRCWVDVAPRRAEKPSDHTPLLVELADKARL